MIEIKIKFFYFITYLINDAFTKFAKLLMEGKNENISNYIFMWPMISHAGFIKQMYQYCHSLEWLNSRRKMKQ